MLLSSNVDLIENSANSYSASEFFTNRDQNLLAHLITTQWSSLHIINFFLHIIKYLWKVAFLSKEKKGYFSFHLSITGGAWIFLWS